MRLNLKAITGLVVSVTACGVLATGSVATAATPQQHQTVSTTVSVVAGKGSSTATTATETRTVGKQARRTYRCDVTIGNAFPDRAYYSFYGSRSYYRWEVDAYNRKTHRAIYYVSSTAYFTRNTAPYNLSNFTARAKYHMRVNGVTRSYVDYCQVVLATRR